MFSFYKIKGTAYRRGSNMEYRVFGPKDVTVDVCSFLNGTWTHILVELVAAYMKKASKSNNVFHSCPFSVSETCTILKINTNISVILGSCLYT